MFGIHKNRPALPRDQQMQVTWSNFEYSQFMRSAYVSEGHMTLRVLGRKGISALIPDGESAIKLSEGGAVKGSESTPDRHQDHGNTPSGPRNKMRTPRRPD